MTCLGLQYEDEVLQAVALSLMPVDEMEAEAEDAASLSRELGEGRGVAAQDALVQELLAWFKAFFTWVCLASCIILLVSAFPNVPPVQPRTSAWECGCSQEPGTHHYVANVNSLL